MKTKLFTIFSSRLAGYLMLNGFKLVGIRKNIIQEHKYVYDFINCEKLHIAISEYKNRRDI